MGLFQALKTSLSYEDLLDLLELEDYAASWKDAQLANEEAPGDG